ncbi:MAG: hypothetical protein ABSA75_05755 [Candidatus Bathyarchaeia archaeon]
MLIDRLNAGDYEVHVDPTNPNARHRIDRQTLKQLISSTLHITDRHCISQWIECLLSLKLIEPNPHTQLSAQKHVKMPTMNTLYFINFDKTIRHTHLSDSLG